MNTITRVQLGAARLDNLIPGWERKISIKMLNMSTDQKCILGQLFQDGYVEGYNVMFPDAESDKQAVRLAVEHGYDNSAGPWRKLRYQKLTSEWKRVLYLRKHKPTSVTEPGISI